MAKVPDIVNAAAALEREGKREQAIAMVRRAVQQAPREAAYHSVLGVMLVNKGELDAAEFHLSRAAELVPGSAHAHANRGNVLTALGRPADAAAAFKEALAIDAASPMATVGLIQALTQADEVEEAVELARAAVGRWPAFAEAYDVGATALMRASRVEEALTLVERGLLAAPGHAGLTLTRASVMTYCDTVEPTQVTAAYREAGRVWMSAAAQAPPPAIESEPDRRLRVGYMSPDLREHSVAYFLEPILVHHDAAAVETFCYSTGPHLDAVTRRLKGLTSHWLDAKRLSPTDLAARIRADGIDILVDLAGFSTGHRLAVLAERPAPVQVTYMGWPTTTGLPTVDWRIVDSVTDPEGAEQFNTEKLHRMEACFLCYRPSVDAPEPAPGPEGPPVFGSFNVPVKVGPRTVALWSRVLREAAGSRLVMKPFGLGRRAARNRLTAEFGAQGIEPDRLEWLEPTPTTREHQASYAKVDVALDPLAYNGTTTTCEALWMGVPVVTLPGNSHASRVGATLMSITGLSEFVAADEGDYVRRAVGLVMDRARLGALRKDLRARVAASPLCDGRGFTRRLEAAYRRMWRARIEGSHA